MRVRRFWLCFVGIVVLTFGWYWFRPELLFIDRVVNESFPDQSGDRPNPVVIGVDDSTVLARGEFRTVAHDTSGTATIYVLDSGSRVLRLTEFETSNGPDVRVYLVAAGDAPDSETVTEAGFIELGPLKGNKGDQNYVLPAQVDLKMYQAVTVWCKRFSVNFGTAPLRVTTTHLQEAQQDTNSSK